ncbi:hypothetical protein WKI71_01945 [Streptomyces sp. MS1.AVA.1]|uniref:Uncharacterized protein n=1 Tax=Streptomyces machairae TaxID=3134109 RepID=A0ABU8UHF6_9ACTN
MLRESDGDDCGEALVVGAVTSFEAAAPTLRPRSSSPWLPSDRRFMASAAAPRTAAIATPARSAVRRRGRAGWLRWSWKGPATSAGPDPAWAR